MNLLGLFLLFAMCVMTGRCWAEQDDLCKSFTEEGAITNGSFNSPIKMLLQHSFLDLDKGVVPGLRYNGKILFNDESPS